MDVGATRENSDIDQECARAMAHVFPKELLTFKDGFGVALGLALARVGSRSDLQIAAAGSHSGPHTIMIVSDEDAQCIREAHSLSPGNQMTFNWTRRPAKFLPDGTLIIFCRDDLPIHPCIAARDEESRI